MACPVGREVEKYMKHTGRVAIIPARGGSKGVPRKNVRDVAGKPLIGWTIEAARAAKSVDLVVVSTDDCEIASVAESFGAKVVWRPAEISGDTASSESALLHALDVLEKEGCSPDELVFLQCTSPLTTGADIDDCVRAMTETNADCAFTAKEFFYFIWKRESDGSAVGINHDLRFRPRRQDREAQYEENGAVYVMKTDGFRRHRHRFFGKTVFSLMPPERCFEIDVEMDMEVATVLLTRRAGTTCAAREFPRKLGAVVFDFDGVMTDDSVWVSTSGEELVKCSRSDGQGIALARKWKVPLLILSSEANAVVSRRAEKLGMEVIQGIGLSGKAEVLKGWAEANGVGLDSVVFMGNDLNDVECMRMCGFAVAPASAHRCAKARADWVLEHDGGGGAVRECLEKIGEQIGKRI